MSVLTDLRLAVLAKGFSPVPNISKACLVKGWPTMPINADAIRSWEERKSPAKRFTDTGLRVENGLAVIDLDINHEVIEHVATAIEERLPVLRNSLVRYGKGAKEAWFVRTDEPFTRLHTRRWLAPGHELEKEGAQVVEIFGGGSPRQFGAVGAHSRAANNDVEIAYEWADDKGPWNTPLANLPELTKADFIAIVDLTEEILEQHGFKPVLKSVKGESEVTRAYDLTADMVFECDDGVVRTLDELEAAAGEGIRCSASWLEPGAGHSLSRCIVGLTHNGALNVWDAATDISHQRKEMAPEASEKRMLDAGTIAEKLRRLAEVESEKKTKRRAKLSSEDKGVAAAAKLVMSYVMCPSQPLQVVPMWAESVSEGMTMTNFRMMNQKHCDVEIGPKKGEKKINPADVWASMDSCVIVDGLRMRPDMPRPIYEDGGRKYINVYSPTIHPEGGDAELGVAFLEQLLPDHDELVWFRQWLAYKYMNPSIPGPAVVMVAREHGTGRGTLAEILKKLFGQRYVKALDFNTFAGKTYQSQYNSWGAESLMVVVNESSDAQGGSVFAAKRDTYERIKDLIEPRPIERHFVRHGLPAFTAKSFTSYCIFTNHPDALPLPQDDRRVWVGTNGEPILDWGYWEELNAWLEQPENIGALARWLEETDLSSYSPFARPPITAGKRAMMEMAASALDQAYDEAVKHLPGEVLVPEQILTAMKEARDANSLEFPDKWDAIARRMVQSKLYRIGVKDGRNWTVKHEKKRYPMYARSQRVATKWTNTDVELVRREVLRSGEPNASKSIGDLLAGLRTVVDNTKG